MYDVQFVSTAGGSLSPYWGPASINKGIDPITLETVESKFNCSLLGTCRARLQDYVFSALHKDQFAGVKLESWLVNDGTHFRMYTAFSSGVNRMPMVEKALVEVNNFLAYVGIKEEVTVVPTTRQHAVVFYVPVVVGKISYLLSSIALIIRLISKRAITAAPLTFENLLNITIPKELIKPNDELDKSNNNWIDKLSTTDRGYLSPSGEQTYSLSLAHKARLLKTYGLNIAFHTALYHTAFRSGPLVNRSSYTPYNGGIHMFPVGAIKFSYTGQRITDTLLGQMVNG